MYDRKIKGKVLEFEASGALYLNALVMQDSQTDSFWPIMDGKAMGGPLQGTPLVELPISEKTTWKDWRTRHPHTDLLIVEGKTHDDNNPYDNYFNSDKTFRPVKKPDTRLNQKETIYAIETGGHHFAITFARAEGGWQGHIGKEPVFIYRPGGSSMYRSTLAWKREHKDQELSLNHEKGLWHSKEYGLFNPETGTFAKGQRLQPLAGIDTFWYIWSQYHPKTLLIQ